MKNVILGLAALCVLSLTSCKESAAAKVNADNVAMAAQRDANAGNLPVIQFNKTEHDFGKIINGTPVETTFEYTNTGNAMLVVSDVKSTCGCTVPKNWTKEVAPGETGSFSVKFNGKGNGKVSKNITMTTNTEKGNEMIKISAFVEKDPNAPQPKAGNATISTLNQPANAKVQTAKRN